MIQRLYEGEVENRRREEGGQQRGRVKKWRIEDNYENKRNDE